MFIFNRPFQPVAAGLAVPLLFVCLDRSCQPLDATPDRPSVASRQAALVTAHSWPTATAHDSIQYVVIIGGPDMDEAELEVAPAIAAKHRNDDHTGMDRAVKRLSQE